LPETSAFLLTSPGSRLAKKTSASSSKRTQAHFCARVKYSSKRLATTSGDVPRSQQVTGKSGHSSAEVTHSAMLVFPTPAETSQTRIIKAWIRVHTWHTMQQDDQASALATNNVHRPVMVLFSFDFVVTTAGKVGLSDLILHEGLDKRLLFRGQDKTVERIFILRQSGEIVNADSAPLPGLERVCVHANWQKHQAIVTTSHFLHGSILNQIGFVEILRPALLVKYVFLPDISTAYTIVNSAGCRLKGLPLIYSRGFCDDASTKVHVP
jgi:hypothetical protein